MAYDTTVKCSSSFEAKCSLVCDSGVSLSDYMRLPVDQYVCIKMPLDATLTRIDDIRFDLTVPPVSFFHLSVSPTIKTIVTQTENSVVIESNECILEGSPYVVGLNGCYKIKIKTIFTWRDEADYKSISSASTVFVEVDPPPPFKYFSRRVLESTGTLAMNIALRQIENAFVQSLARDYEKWATDRIYRLTRARCEINEDGSIVTPPSTSSNTLSSTSAISTSSSPPIENIVQTNVDTKATVNESVDEVVPEEMIAGSPASLTDDVCLIPGKPVVRIEEAPNNARRIFTGIDIMASVDDIWGVLTDYEHLQDVVPSLVKNEVLERYPDGGARLMQVGGAKVLPGVTFTAKTVLDIRTYTESNPLAPEMTADYVTGAIKNSLDEDESKKLPLRRGVFPRPYAYTSLPHRDITMQNVEGEGDFDHFQSIWRVQNLPGCAPEGAHAARLTYAVELRPKGFLPVRLIEGRIATDLIGNLDAIKLHVETSYQKKKNALAAKEKQAKDVKVSDIQVMSPVQSAAAAAIASVKSNAITPPLSYSTPSISQQQTEQEGKQEQQQGQLSVSELSSEIDVQKGLRAILNTIKVSNQDIPRSVNLEEENRLLRERIAELTDEIQRTKKLLSTIEELSRG